MRIAMITGEYPPTEGGVGDFTRQLGLALQQQGHEIHILTTKSPSLPEERAEDEMIIHRKIGTWGWSIHGMLTRWLREVAPDVANIQYQTAAYEMHGAINLYPRWQRRNLTIPLVVTYHDLLPPYLFPKAGPLRQWTVWQLAQYAHGAIVTNEADYRQLTAALRDLPPVRLIPIGSNIAPQPPRGYDPAAWRKAHGFAEHDLLLGFFGFLNRSKGVETLLEATAQLRADGVPAHILLIGGRTGSSDRTNAAYADEVDAQIAHLGLTEYVHRTGFSAPPEVSAALMGVNLCVLPYRDGVNLRRGTFHAALVHGCAIITTQAELMPEQLQDGEPVVLVPPEDAASLAEAIQRVWRAPRLCEKLRRGAQELSQEFSWQRIARHTAEFFRELSDTVAASE